MRRESSDTHTEGGSVAVGPYTAYIDGCVGLGWNGRYSVAPCLTFDHNADSGNTRLRFALEAHVFAEREVFAVVAAYSFPARTRPMRPVNTHSAGMSVAAPPADRGLADHSRSHRTREGHRQCKPYHLESDSFHRGFVHLVSVLSRSDQGF